MLRAELERLFELDELCRTSRDILGFDPERVGGTATLASFAGALTEHCAEHDAIEALCDVILATKGEVSPQITALRVAGLRFDEELAKGHRLGPLEVTQKLGEGRLGVSYLATLSGQAHRLKVLRREAARDTRGLQRFLTLTRLIGGIEHPGLPQGLCAAEFEQRFVVYHRHVEGQSLSARLSRSGPFHLNDARPLLIELLSALGALHARRIAHGDLRLENVILKSDTKHGVLLLDAASDRLRARARPGGDRSELFSTVVSPRTVAPEQIQGLPADALSDIYSFGALLYEMLTGRPVFPGTGLEAAFGHLSRKPEPPSAFAPHGWITSELDAFVLSLLEKEPQKRPASVQAVLDSLSSLGRPQVAETTSSISDEALNERIEALLADAENSDAAIQLEAAVEQGAAPARVGEAFIMAAELLTADHKRATEAKRSLLFRAARLFESSEGTLESAESAYLKLCALDVNDEIALSGLEEVRKRLGKYEELIETLLGRSERAESGTERARAMAEIGRIYLHELDDRDQAAFAFTQAFCHDPGELSFAEEVERLAGNDQAKWTEVLDAIGEAVSEEPPVELKNQLLVQAGRWYMDKVNRLDLALPCFQSVAATDPANDKALVGMAEIYKKAQQWPELVIVLSRRADAAPTPALARDLRADVADVLEYQLSDLMGARDLYLRILSEDPGHPKAADALARIYEHTKDYEGLVELLDRRVQAQRGDDKLRLLCRIAEVYEDQLRDDDEAISRYQAVLKLQPGHLDALRGLDRVYSRAGRYRDLLANLKSQIELSATPRQKINLWQRIAGIYEEEFLDHEKSSQAWDEVLGLDSSHEAALTSLSRHCRALSRWQRLSELYERQIELASDSARKVELRLSLAELYCDQLPSPEKALAIYEQVLATEPAHAVALDAVARLRESAGDADAALEAIMALAEKATTPEAKAEQFMRAAKFLESRGDRDGAIEQYKRALDAHPKNPGISQALREAYVARGDIAAAAEWLEREIEHTEGQGAKARLSGELARLAHSRLQDAERAEHAAKRALSLDPTNRDALSVLGTLAFENKRYLEASSHYERLLAQVESLAKDEAVRIIIRYVDSLSQSGSTERAMTAVDVLHQLAADDPTALERVAFVNFQHGSPERAVQLYTELLNRFEADLSPEQRALSLYRRGEIHRRSGNLAAALTDLEAATDLAPTLSEPLEGIAQVYAAQENWEKMLHTRSQQLDLVEGEQRIAFLLEMGDLAANKLGDRTQAAKHFVAALEERPDDRRLLTKLMQLYSEEKDWNKLIEIVVRLADFVDEPEQKVKYLHTAAIVTFRQVGDLDHALEYYEQVLTLDPAFMKAYDDAIEIERERHRLEGAERLLKRKLQVVTEQDQQSAMLQTFSELGELYANGLGDIDKAIDAYEAAQTLDPENRERAELLTELYATDSAKYLERAASAHALILRHNPYRPESYKMLRRLYTEVKDPDASWCLCQALSVLNLAEPDEERFYLRMRSETAAPAERAFTDEDWLSSAMHPSADPLLTSVFALIERAVIGQRGRAPQDFGYDSGHLIDLTSHPAPIAQNIHYAAGVLGLTSPSTYENTNDPGGLSFLHAYEPSLVLGCAALAPDVPPQTAAFIAARHLTFYRPGMYLRQLISTTLGLKAWLFAAIKVVAPQFPVAADFEGPVNEALEELARWLEPETREHVTLVVSKLLHSGAALDLKRWIQGVDLTADRAGFIVSHDLETATEIIKASGEGSSAVSNQERIKELVLFSVSPEYFALRRSLGIAVDS